MKHQFPAIIDKDPDSDYGVSFPDFPGCVTAGETPEEAIKMAAEALAFHVEGMIADGDELPTPTPLETVSWDDDENVMMVTLVPVILPGKAKRINITLDENLIDEIDAVSNNRSGFLANAARDALTRRHAV